MREPRFTEAWADLVRDDLPPRPNVLGVAIVLGLASFAGLIGSLIYILAGAS